MRKSFILGSVAALAISGQALAEDGFSYTYLDLGYADRELEADDLGFDLDGDGFALGGSFGLTDRIHLVAGFTDLELEVDGQDAGVDAQVMSFGGGVHLPLQSNIDFVGTISYVKGELDGAGGDVDEDGFSLGAGLRGQVAEQLELTGGIQYLDGDLGDFLGDTSFNLGARYFFSSAFALVADMNLGDDTTAWTLGARFNFNK
jgi:hypothetical protein